MNKEEMIWFSAEIVGRVCPEPVPDTVGNILQFNNENKDSLPLIHWRPAEDSNQLDMIEAELVKLGFDTEETLDKLNFQIYIQFHTGDLDTSFFFRNFGTVESKRLTKLKAFCEAMMKFREDQG